MVTRDRRQVVAIEARRAFEGVLQEWVYHRLDYHGQDYGVDGQVELFSAGEATGMKFEAQLKGSDQPLEKALVVTLAPRHASYYSALDLPVMIVLFHAPSSAIYWRWFHSFDPHDGGFSGSTIRLRLSPDDIWNEETREAIVADLTAIQQMRLAKFTMPLTFGLRFRADSQNGFSPAEVAMQLRSAARQHDRYIRIHTDRPSASTGPAIVFHGDRTVFEVGAQPLVTVHHETTHHGDLTTFVADVLVGAALVLLRLGLSGPASEIAASHMVQSRAGRDIDVAMRIGAAFAGSRNVELAVSVAEQLWRIDNRHDQLVADTVLTALGMSRTELRYDERARVAHLRTRWTLELDVAGQPERAGVQQFNLAGMHKSASDYDDALAAYNRAAELRPTYLQEERFRRHRGAANWFGERFADAAEDYGAAVECGAPVLTKAHLADALLFAGRYAESCNALDRYLKEAGADAVAEYYLKHWAVTNAIAMTGLRVQKRDTPTASRIAGELMHPEAEATMSHLWTALNADMLWGGTWFNLGVVGNTRREAPDPEFLFLCFVMAGVCVPHDHEAWANATLYALATERLNALLPLTILTGYQYGSSKYLARLMGVVDAQGRGEMKSQLMECVNVLINHHEFKRDYDPDWRVVT